MSSIGRAITNYFFVWTVLAGIAALLFPPAFTWFRGAWIPFGLAVIMLGMGITLTIDDFRRVVLDPRRAALGVFLQYLIMPLLGWSAGYLFRLSPPEAVGLILVASCPGGTASNVITFLARGNVGLSVAMTAVSTVIAVVLTPSLTELLVGGRVEVDLLGLFYTTLGVVLVPVALGVFINRYLKGISRALAGWAPPVAVIFIILIVGSVLATSGRRLGEGGGGAALVGSVVFLHSLGFVLGYLLAWVWTKDALAARTISIEVGMQNSGLAVELARRNFPDPLTALPGALSALTHCVLGSLLAAIWRATPVKSD